MSSDPAALGGGARFLLVAASFVVVVAGMRAAAALIVPFLIAAFIAIVSAPVLGLLKRLRVPTVIGILLTVLAVATLLVGLSLIVSRSVDDLAAGMPPYRDRAERLISSLAAWLRDRGVETSDWGVWSFIQPDAVLAMTRKTIGAATALLTNFVLILLTLVFILVEAAGFPAKLHAAFGRRSAVDRFTAVVRQVQRFLAIKTLTSLMTGVLIGIAAWVMGISGAVLWGLLAFLLNFIPNIGSIVAALPPVLLALVRFGVVGAGIMAGVCLAVNIFVSNIVEPPLMGRRLGLSTLVVFASLVFWAWVLGPVGMLFSVPLTAAAKIALENTQDLRWVAVLLDKNPKPARSGRRGASGV